MWNVCIWNCMVVKLCRESSKMPFFHCTKCTDIVPFEIMKDTLRIYQLQLNWKYKCRFKLNEIFRDEKEDKKNMKEIFKVILSFSRLYYCYILGQLQKENCLYHSKLIRKQKTASETTYNCCFSYPLLYSTSD